MAEAEGNPFENISDEQVAVHMKNIQERETNVGVREQKVIAKEQKLEQQDEAATGTWW